ncbi:accessory gene regulator B family protein [Shouchella sp. 1P09AA]|uniref:accessory gene regulator ArgB-like protein n=1 Tax=unclassified Shouchella TaxID=2893065 RepID=UPI0039A18FF4
MNVFSPRDVSVSLAALIAERIPEYAPKQDEIRYGLEWTLAVMFQISVIVLFSLIVNLFIETMICLFVGIFLRAIGGGAHFASYMKCAIYSIGVIVLIVLAPVYWVTISEPILMVIALFSLLAYAVYAPVLHKTKHLFTDKKKRLFKWMTVGFILVLMVVTFVLELSSPTITTIIWLSVFLQAVSLTKPFHYFIAWVDDKTTIRRSGAV